MDNALQTLFYPFETGMADWPSSVARCLFLGARAHPALKKFDVKCVQAFRPYALELELAGFEVDSSIRADDEADCDEVFVLLPKNKVEAEYLLAVGLRALCDGGRLVCAADNKSGGAAISKMLAGFGFKDFELLSKHKARVAVVEKHMGEMNFLALENAFAAGAMQKVLGGRYISMPGVYGWDKVDKGSEILVSCLPDDLVGDIADFGCGYGYLSLAAYDKAGVVMNSLHYIDADARALACARQNLEEARLESSGYWLDLTKRYPEFSQRFDTILMNPPFHEGKKADITIGKAFIENAAFSLKAGGRLYMVANSHLPYEQILKMTFKTYEKLYEGGGFKVFLARR